MIISLFKEILHACKVLPSASRTLITCLHNLLLLNEYLTLPALHRKFGPEIFSVASQVRRSNQL